MVVQDQVQFQNWGVLLGQHSLEHPGNCLSGPTFNSVGRRSRDLAIVGSIHHTTTSSYSLLLVVALSLVLRADFWLYGQRSLLPAQGSGDHMGSWGSCVQPKQAPCLLYCLTSPRVYLSYWQQHCDICPGWQQNRSGVLWESGRCDCYVFGLAGAFWAGTHWHSC